MGELRNPSDLASQNKTAKPIYDSTGELNHQQLEENDKAGSTIGSANAKPVLRLRFPDRSNCASWEALLWDDKLYVSVTPKQLAGGSKEAFVSLLEYAEDHLECSHVIVCLIKNENDDDERSSGLSSLIKNFMFLGFSPLARRQTELLPKKMLDSNPDMVCFVYTI